MRNSKLTAAAALIPLVLAGCGGGTGAELGTASSAETVATTPSPSSTPASTPTPTPTATTASSGSTVVGSNTDDGFPQLDKVAPNYDRTSMLQASWGKGTIAPDNGADTLGAFRLICAPSHLAYDDPIVYPGQPGKSHLHLFFGNDKTDANSDYQSLRTQGKSSCGLLNRSGYWMPALLDGHGNVVLPDYATVYYKRRPASDPLCKPGSELAPKGCIGLPRGLRYIFGRTMEGTAYADNRTDGVNFVCTGTNISSHNLTDILRACPAGEQLGVQVVAPDCWNGKDLDTPDHRSHMAYTYYGSDGKPRCPATHPYMIPTFTFDTWYTIPATGLADAYFSSDRMPGRPVMPAGSTVHSDWFGAWDDDTLKGWIDGCINGHLNCSGGDLGDGKQMIGAQMPEYGWRNPNAIVPVPANPNA